MFNLSCHTINYGHIGTITLSVKANRDEKKVHLAVSHIIVRLIIFLLVLILIISTIYYQGLQKLKRKIAEKF